MTNATILQNMLDEAIILNQKAHKAHMVAIAEGDLKGAEDRREERAYFFERIAIIEEIAEALGEHISEGNAVIYA